MKSYKPDIKGQVTSIKLFTRLKNDNDTKKISQNIEQLNLINNSNILRVYVTLSIIDCM